MLYKQEVVICNMYYSNEFLVNLNLSTHNIVSPTKQLIFNNINDYQYCKIIDKNYTFVSFWEFDQFCNILKISILNTSTEWFIRWIK